VSARGRRAQPSPEPREVIIDGYNVLLTEERGGSEHARQQLVRDAARHRDRRDVAVTVVFDGRGAAGVTEATSYAGVRVLYAADADRAIVARVQRSRAPGALLVITADRALQNDVRALGGRAEPPASFRRRPGRSAAAAPSSSEKPGHVSKTEVDYWLGVFGSGDDKDEREPEP